MKNLERYLNSFGKSVVKQSKARLQSSDKVVSGSLLNSIRYEVKQDKDNFVVRFFMAEHGKFIDKGVSGKKQRQYYKDIQGKRRQSPFKYKSKRPPASMLDKWIVRRGIAPRDAKGRFMSRKSLQYLISNKIFFKGTKGISFFTTPVRLAMKDLPKDILVAIRKDIINSIK